LPVVEMDIKTIEDVALLARLNMTPDEISGLRGDLENILAYADQLSALNTEGVQPLAHPGDIVNALREDEVVGSLDRAVLQRNSPKSDDGFYLVPAVLGEAKLTQE
jgi:aspartyl-tRNA(Asn)/glutamyl-tRNA(Gln) amidotransferase subunit C